MRKDLDFRPDLEAVFEFYGARVLSGGGAWVKAECPLLAHEDQNPSASMNADAGKWSCFSCGNAGDAFDIIQANEDTCAGYPEALRFAKENFADGGRAVRPQRGPGSGLPVRSGPRAGRRNWSPPWNRA